MQVQGKDVFVSAAVVAANISFALFVGSIANKPPPLGDVVLDTPS